MFIDCLRRVRAFDVLNLGTAIKNLACQKIQYRSKVTSLTKTLPCVKIEFALF